MILPQVETFGDVFAARGDKWRIGKAIGGKARTCWHLAQGARGLITAGSRSSPQANIVAQVAKELGIPCRVHTPQGELSAELIMAQEAGAEIVQHKAGYNSVIVARARDDAEKTGWTEIPFGMECEEAINQTAPQVACIPESAKRIVVPVGSGMSLAGILQGVLAAGVNIPILGVSVGADPSKRLDKYAPLGWQQMVQLVQAGSDYGKPAAPEWRGILLDPFYEAKAAQFLQSGDLLWIVGIRASMEKQ